MNQDNISNIKPKKHKKLWLWLLIIIPLFAFWIFLLAIGFTFKKKYQAFEQASGFPPKTLTKIIQNGYQKSQLYQAQNKIDTTILLLGIDSLDNRGEIPPLTDSMMIVRLHFDTGRINILSLPRDIWNESYQTKINALLAYGYERDSNNPTAFPAKAISELTHIHIDHTLVLSLEQLEEFIDIVGGIEVTIPIGFIDDEFPRDDVDIYTETDPAKLYQTITFEAGKQLMTGEKALQYIRSRKSADENGTDIARGERQQLIFQAFFTKLTDYNYLYEHPEIAGKIMRFYYNHFDKAFSFTDIVATMSAMIPVMDQLEIVGQTLSTDPDNPDGVLYNPPHFEYQNLWVYLVKDLQAFRKEVLTKLNTPAN